MESKETELEQFKSLIKQSESRINAILDRFGWSKESISLSGVNKSTSIVEVVNKREPVDTFPPSFHSQNNPSSITLDNIKQADAILENSYQDPSFELGVSLDEIEYRKPPANLEDLQVNFTRQERLSLCHHVLRNTIKPPEVPDLKIRFRREKNSVEKSTSLSEVAAINRDARRRNPKHRTSKYPLSYHEELRQLIQFHTEVMVQHIQQIPNNIEAGCSKVEKPSERQSKSSSRSVDTKQGDGRKKQRRSKSRTKDRYRERSSSNEKKRRKLQDN